MAAWFGPVVLTVTVAATEPELTCTLVGETLQVVNSGVLAHANLTDPANRDKGDTWSVYVPDPPARVKDEFVAAMEKSVIV